jgi:predicted phage terminase large subunit-like protein
VIVESKASGLPLTYELRKMGIPVINFTPSKGNDKHSRVNAVAPLFESGQIWAPDHKFAEEVIEECAAFPFGDHDDLVDSMTQALMRFRQGGFIEHPEDYEDEKIIHEEKEYY